jgi:hypothetical protein
MIWSLYILSGGFRRSGRDTLPPTQEWLAELTTQRYRPMCRLLDEGDWRFLRGQRGFRPEIEKGLRRQRILLFRAYLRTLEGDFHRLCGALDDALPDVAAQRRAIFAWRMTLVRVRLKLYEWGVGQADASPLVSLFDEVRAEVVAGTPAAEPVPA